MPQARARWTTCGGLSASEWTRARGTTTAARRCTSRASRGRCRRWRSSSSGGQIPPPLTTSGARRCWRQCATGTTGSRSFSTSTGLSWGSRTTTWWGGPTSPTSSRKTTACRSTKARSGGSRARPPRSAGRCATPCSSTTWNTSRGSSSSGPTLTRPTTTRARACTSAHARGRYSWRCCCWMPGLSRISRTVGATLPWTTPRPTVTRSCSRCSANM
mmetsp:Transcript_37196/g.117069  ORF Transcript_37196/g.117069 Transcript_37196/m.117069 type:complete len:216 (+) Transcript_37196:3013-3660(+)